MKFESKEKAKAAMAEILGKYGVDLVEIAGKCTLVVGSECVYDDLWNALFDEMKKFPIPPQATFNEDRAVEEASRLRDEFIESLKKVYGIDDVMSAITEF